MLFYADCGECQTTRPLRKFRARKKKRGVVHLR